MNKAKRNFKKVTVVYLGLAIIYSFIFSTFLYSLFFIMLFGFYVTELYIENKYLTIKEEDIYPGLILPSIKVNWINDRNEVGCIINGVAKIVPMKQFLNIVNNKKERITQ